MSPLQILAKCPLAKCPLAKCPGFVDVLCTCFIRHLGYIDLKAIDKLDILGVSFNPNDTFTDFAQSKINKCRRFLL